MGEAWEGMELCDLRLKIGDWRLDGGYCHAGC